MSVNKSTIYDQRLKSVRYLWASIRSEILKSIQITTHSLAHTATSITPSSQATIVYWSQSTSIMTQFICLLRIWRKLSSRQAIMRTDRHTICKTPFLSSENTKTDTHTKISTFIFQLLYFLYICSIEKEFSLCEKEINPVV